MASFNITDKWLEDPRRDHLKEKLGEMMADGLALKMWRLAFTWFKDGHEGNVPGHLFDKVPHSETFLEADLAERRGDQVYIRGSKDEFKWYKSGIDQRSEAGKASAAARKAKYGSAVPPNASNATNHAGPNVTATNSNDPERPPNANRTEPNGAEPSSFSSPSSHVYDSGGGDFARVREGPAAADFSAGETKAAEIPKPAIVVAELADDPYLATRLVTVPVKVQVAWLEAYPNRIWLKNALRHACSHYEAKGPPPEFDWKGKLTTWLAHQHVKAPPAKQRTAPADPPPSKPKTILPPEKIQELRQEFDRKRKEPPCPQADSTT